MVPASPKVHAAVGRPEMPEAEAAVWDQWAEHARLAGTLTPATVEDFRDFCELVVEVKAIRDERRAEGYSSRGLALAREYRALMVRVEAKRRAFRLAPMGKPMESGPAVPDDPFSEFDQPEAEKTVQ